MKQAIYTIAAIAAMVYVFGEFTGHVVYNLLNNVTEVFTLIILGQPMANSPAHLPWRITTLQATGYSQRAISLSLGVTRHTVRKALARA